jgi:hypothetical protein
MGSDCLPGQRRLTFKHDGASVRHDEPGPDEEDASLPKRKCRSIVHPASDPSAWP